MRCPPVAAAIGLVVVLTFGTVQAATVEFHYVTTSNILGDPISAHGYLDLTPDPDLDGAYLVDSARGRVDGSRITGLDDSFAPLIFEGPTGTDDEILGFTTAGGVTYDFAANASVSSAGDLDLGRFRVSAVPLPTAAPLFGAALAALGAVGYGLRRKARLVA